MNKTDEYWFFIEHAIANSKTNFHYFYDREVDILFSIIDINNQPTPNFRNSITSQNEQVKEAFEREIKKIETKNQNVILLPHLTFNDKKEFLTDVYSKTNDPKLRKSLEPIIEAFQESSDFMFRIINQFTFDVQRAKFISKKVDELYTPFGVSERSKVLW